MFTKIIAGVDDAPAARDAATLAEALAAACGADLVLAAAYQDPLLPFPLTVGGASHRVADADHLLHTIRPACAPHAHTVAIPDVSPVRGLRRTVEREHADLLVLGSADNTPDGEVHAGRTGRHLLHEVPCAVGFAARGIDEKGFALRRVVVGVDETPESAAALEQARALIAATGGELVVVSVVDDRVPVDPAPFGTVVELTDWDETVERRRHHVVGHLDRVLTDLPEAVREVRVGDPAEEIAQLAEGADLIVLGTRRQTAMQRLALGSTSEQLCGSAPCSVLIVPR